MKHFEQSTFSNAEKIDSGAEAAEQLRYYLDENEKLRPSQRSALEAIADHYENGEHSGLIKRPTGTGKTVIFGSQIKALQALYGSQKLPKFDLKEEGKRSFEPNFLILVPTTHLANQTKRELTKADGLVGMDEEEVAVFNPKDLDAGKTYERGLEAVQAPVTIMTYAAYRTMMHTSIEKQQASSDWREVPEDKYEGLRRYLDPKYRPFTIMDEADEAIGPVQTPLFKDLARKTHALGFSATDKCIDEKGELNNVANVLFRTEQQELDDEEVAPIASLSFRDAMRDKDNPEVAPTKNVVFELETESGVESKSAEYTQEELKQITSQEGRDAAAVKRIAEFTDPETGRSFLDMQQIWYCTDIKHAKDVTELLNKVHGEGYAVQIDGKTDKKELHDILESHREKGVPPVLVNADLLIRGFDSPATELCVMLRPTKSPSLVEQAGGRIARLDPDNPHKIGYVVNFVDSDMKDVALFGKVVGGMFVTPEGYELPSNKDYLEAKKRKPTRSKETPDFSEIPEADNVAIPETHFTLKHIEKFVPSDNPIQILADSSSMLTNSRMEKQLHLKPEALLYTFSALENAMEEEAQKPEYEGQPVPPDTPITIEREGRSLTVPYGEMGVYRYANNPTPRFFVHAKHGLEMAGFMGIADMAPEGWKGSVKLFDEVKQRFGADYQQYNFASAYRKAEQAVVRARAKKNPPTHVKFNIKDRIAEIPLEDLEFYRVPEANGKTRLCVNERSLGAFVGLFEAFPPKTEDWLTRFEAASSIGTSKDNPQFIALWEDMQRQFDEAGVITVGDRTINAERRASGIHAALCLNVEELDWLKEQLGKNAEPKSPEWKNKTEAAKLVNIAVGTAIFHDLWTDMQRQFDEGEEVTVGERVIRFEPKTMNNVPTHCLHEDEIEWLRKQVGKDVEPKTADWMTRVETSVETGISGNAGDYKALWKELDAEYEKEGVIKDGERVVRLEPRHSKHSNPLCLHKDEVGWFIKRLGRAPKKTEEWKTKGEVAAMFAIASGNKELSALWDQMATSAAAGQAVMVDDRPVKAEMRKSGSPTVLCLHEDEMSWLKDRLGIVAEAKTDAWNTKTDVAKRVRVTPANTDFVALWAEIEKQYTADGKVNIDGRDLKVEQKRSGSMTLLCIHDDDIDWVQKKLKRHYAEKTPEWQSTNDIARILSVGTTSAAFTAVWTDMMRQYDDTGSVTLGGRPIRAERRITHSLTSFYVHEDDLHILKEHLESAKAPEKTDDWMTRKDAATLLKVAYNADTPLAALWESLETQLSEEGQVRIGDEVIRAERRTSGTSDHFCIHVDELAKLKKALGINYEDKTDDWLSSREAALEANANAGNDLFTKFWKDMERQYDETGRVVFGDKTLKAERRRSGGHTPLLLHRDDISWVSERFGLNFEPKTEKWHGRKEVAGLVQTAVSTPSFKKLWAEMEAKCEADGKVKYGDRVIKAERRRSGSYASLCLHEDDIEWMKGKLGKNAPLKTDEWHPRSSAFKLAKTTRSNETFMSLWDDMEAQFAENGKVEFDGRAIHAEMRLSRSVPVLCLHEDDIEWLKWKIGKPSTYKPETDGTWASRTGKVPETGWQQKIDKPDASFAVAI